MLDRLKYTSLPSWSQSPQPVIYTMVVSDLYTEPGVDVHTQPFPIKAP